MSAGGAILPVLTVITNAAGVPIGDAQELRLTSSLTGTLVATDAVPRIELSVAPDTSGRLPSSSPVDQVSFLAAGHNSRILAFASSTAPSYFTGAAFFADGSLVASDTNYVDVALYDGAPDGTHGAALATATTKTTVSGGTGTWAGGAALAFSLAIGVEIPAGHFLVAVWTQHNAGVDMPGGWWRIT